MSSNIIRASTYILPEHTVLVKDEALLLELDPEDAQAFASMHVVQSKRVWERYKNENPPWNCSRKNVTISFHYL